MFGITGPHMSDSSATFSGLWDLFMACCNITSSLGVARESVAYIRLQNSKHRISNHVVAAKLRTDISYNAEFMVSKFLCINVRKNLFSGPPHFRGLEEIKKFQ